MPPTTIHTAPDLESFTALAEHQSQTPATFYNAKPVLHYHATGARALASQDQLSSLPIFSLPADDQSLPDAENKGVVVERVDVYISSENLVLFNPTKAIGFSIPYPAISLHAIQRLPDPSNASEEVQGLYMQLELPDPNGGGEEDEAEAIELTLVPASIEAEGSPEIQKLFLAVSNCSNLHPDPADNDEEMSDALAGDSRIVFEGNVGYEGISGLPNVHRGTTDGGLPPPFPGSGGWITAENVSEYFDEEGNWIGGGGEEGGSLGEGAGRTRTREEMDEDGMNGHGGDESEDSKRPRTD